MTPLLFYPSTIPLANHECNPIHPPAVYFTTLLQPSLQPPFWAGIYNPPPPLLPSSPPLPSKAYDEQRHLQSAADSFAFDLLVEAVAFSQAKYQFGGGGGWGGGGGGGWDGVRSRRREAEARREVGGRGAGGRACVCVCVGGGGLGAGGACVCLGVWGGGLHALSLRCEVVGGGWVCG